MCYNIIMKFLERFALVIFAAAALAACTGEPPQWWNPNNVYSNLNPVPVKDLPVKPAPPPPAPAAQPQPAPAVVQPADGPIADDDFTPVKEDAVEVTDLPSPSVLQ